VSRNAKQTTLTGSSIEDWDFVTANTTELTHGIHSYPARMVPQIANRLIHTYSRRGETVFDPFCGSGTVLLEAYRLGRKSIGADINPLAIRISKAKTSRLSDREIDRLNQKVLELSKSPEMDRKTGRNVPEVSNLEYWFQKQVIDDLARLKFSIDKIPMTDEYRNLFYVCLSSTIYDVANLDKRDNPYFLRTLKGDKLVRFRPEVFGTYWQKLDDARSKVRDLNRSLRESDYALFPPEIHLCDSRELIQRINPFRLLLTSPPYGEEKNTMSYMRFAKLACHWIDHTAKELKDLEKKSLGSEPKVAISWHAPSSELRKLLGMLEKNGELGRAAEVKGFFFDYYDLLSKANKKLLDKGHFIIVIGNRTAKGMPVRNDLVSQEFCESLGMRHVQTHYRNIPKKVLPRSDAKGTLINAESIVIMQK